MARKSPSHTKAQALQIREAWANIGPDMTYGDLTLTEFQAGIAEMEAAEATIADVQDQLTNARNTFHDKRNALWALVKRARAGAKARHGDDSDVYERFGGTRLSERKPPRRSAPPIDEA